MCIGEMCATLQVLARERHGHGRGPWNARYDRKLTAQLHRLASQNKILQRGHEQQQASLHSGEPLEQGFVMKDLVRKQD